MYLFERSNGSFNHLDPEEFPSVFVACTQVYPRPKFILLNNALGPLSLCEENPMLVHSALEDDRDLFGSIENKRFQRITNLYVCLLYTSPSPRDGLLSRMPSSA